MTPTVRKFLPISAFLLISVAVIYALKTQRLSRSPAPGEVGAVPPSRTPHPLPRKAASPPQLAFLTDPGQPWQVRVDLLRSHLSSECGEQEIRYLYELLAQGPAKGELPEHWYIIANDLMIQLARHDSDAERFSSSFLGLLHDPKQPVVLRDYAVQYLVTWLNPHSPQASPHQSGAAAKPSPEVTDLVLQSLVAATTDPELEQSSIPGTALMMLVDLTRFPGEVDCNKAVTRLKPWLTHALQESSTLSTPVRVSAIQAAGALAPEEFRPALRKIAYQNNGQSSLRLPAIAALGRCGEAGDLDRLEEIARVHPELSYAAREAGRKLTYHLSQAASQ